MRRKWIFAGVLIIVLGLVMIFARASIFDLVYPIIEQSKSPTIQLTPEAERLFYLILYILAISFLVIGSVVAGSSKATVRNALKQTFLIDEMCKTNPSIPKPVTILVLSSLISIFFASLYTIRGLFNLEYHYLEDGLFEYLTAINYLAASLLIAISIWSVRKLDSLRNARNYKVIITTLTLILIFFFVIGMEEISWGQRIIGWETPTPLTRLNYSDETNIHNIFTPFFKNLYRGFGLFFLISLIVGWLFVRRWHPFFYHIIFPHPNLIVLVYLITLVGLTNPGELFEELFSLFCLFYAIRVYLCFRSEEQIADLLFG
ncbi:MAG: hypothetical protein FVQ83_08635 [Chloroflexi bacterium]|nr:hypothetical protein [Chloroflexota bacterium]